MRRVVVIFLAVGLAAGCSGCSKEQGTGGATGDRGKDGQAGKDAAKPTASSKAAGMTREEFKAKLKALRNEDWPGEQHVAPRSKKGLIRTFGEPTRTQTLGERLSWFYQCKDGTVQIVLRARSGYENPDFHDQIEVNDW